MRICFVSGAAAQQRAGCVDVFFFLFFFGGAFRFASRSTGEDVEPVEPSSSASTPPNSHSPHPLFSRCSMLNLQSSLPTEESCVHFTQMAVPVAGGMALRRQQRWKKMAYKYYEDQLQVWRACVCVLMSQPPPPPNFLPHPSPHPPTSPNPCLYLSAQQTSLPKAKAAQPTFVNRQTTTWTTQENFNVPFRQEFYSTKSVGQAAQFMQVCLLVFQNPLDRFVHTRTHAGRLDPVP